MYERYEKCCVFWKEMLTILRITFDRSIGGGFINGIFVNINV